MKIFFTIILYVDVILSLASFTFAYILLRRGRNQIYFNFGMSTLFLGIWMLVTLLDYFRFTPLSSDFHARLGFLMGIWILHYFSVFSFYFPTRKAVKILSVPFLYLGSLIISLLIFLPQFIASTSVDFPFRYRTIDPILLTIYNLYFFLLTIISFKNLFKSYENSEGIFRIQLKKIIGGTSIAVLANIIFSLVNFYYTSFDLTCVGMFFTFTVLIYIYSILFSEKV